MINLWNPHLGISLGAALATALILGMVHGITPDEHTWPITFSYAIGSYSTRKGALAGLVFSLAFTIQRALASELAYLSLGSWLVSGSSRQYFVYIVIGVIMVWAGRATLRGRHWHLFGGHHAQERSEATDPKPWMPAVHGFVAGWGFGAFAMIIYTVLAPAMPGPAWGWVPGAAFGLGTTIMQVIAGGLFGWISARRGLAPEAIRSVALTTAGRTMGWGGVAFIMGGGFGLGFPKLAGWSFYTGIHVHNLDRLGIGFVLVMVTVLGIGVGTLIRETHYWLRHKPST